jgi:hypothetical protein
MQQTQAQTKPEMIIDMLCQHQYYDSHPRPTKEEFMKLKSLCGDPSIDEMFLAVTNLVARQDEFPNPPMTTLRMIGFKKGFCDIGPAKSKKAQSTAEGGESYWGQAWNECLTWFTALPNTDQHRLKEQCREWLRACTFAHHCDSPFAPKSPGRSWLLHRRKQILNPAYGEFCLNYERHCQQARELNSKKTGVFI